MGLVIIPGIITHLQSKPTLIYAHPTVTYIFNMTSTMLSVRAPFVSSTRALAPRPRISAARAPVVQRRSFVVRAVSRTSSQVWLNVDLVQQHYLPTVRCGTGSELSRTWTRRRVGIPNTCVQIRCYAQMEGRFTLGKLARVSFSDSPVVIREVDRAS